MNKVKKVMEQEMKSQLLSIGQVQKLLGVHIDTLRKWDKTGKLKAVRIGDKKGWRRYKLSDIEKLIK